MNIKKYIGIFLISLLLMLGIHQFIFMPFNLFHINNFNLPIILDYGIYIFLFLVSFLIYLKGIFKVNKKNFLINFLFLTLTFFVILISTIIDFFNITKKFYIEDVQKTTGQYFDISYFDFLNIFIRTIEFNFENIQFRLLLGVIFFTILNIILIYFIRREIKKEKLGLQK